MPSMSSLDADTALDPSKADEFADRLLAALNGGALCLMASIGHRTGLFDALHSGGSATSSQLAESAGLDERYVREWLGAMTAAGVVECDPSTQTYALPPEHAAFLTREASPNNLAVVAQYVGMMGSVEDDIVHCFRHGGGVPYSRYPRFHEVMAEDSAQTVLSVLLERILPLAGVVHDQLLEGIRVLDVGCGHGAALIRMAARYPASRFKGIDLSEEAVEVARVAADRVGLTNVDFVAQDLATFDADAEPEAYELVTAFDAIHDQPWPRAVLRGICRTLAPDGVFLMQDIHGSSLHHENLDHPIGTFNYTISCMHCMTVSLAQGGEGLGAMWGRQKASELLEEAGFSQIAIHRLEHDIQNDFYIARKDP